MRYNLEQNICRLFHFLAQFLVTTSETELDYYTTEWMYELPHILPKDLSKIGNLRKLGTLRKLENFNFSLQPFDHDCLRKQIFIASSVQILDFTFFVDLLFEKSHLLFKLIFRATQLQKKSEYDIFQKTLFCSLVSSLNLGLNAVPVATGQYLWIDFTFFY